MSKWGELTEWGRSEGFASLRRCVQSLLFPRWVWSLERKTFVHTDSVSCRKQACDQFHWCLALSSTFTLRLLDVKSLLLCDSWGLLLLFSMNVHGLKSLPVSNSPLTCWSLCFSELWFSCWFSLPTCRGFCKSFSFVFGFVLASPGRSVSVSVFSLLLLWFPVLISFLYDLFLIQVNISLRLKSIFQQNRGQEARKLNAFLHLALSFISPSWSFVCVTACLFFSN